MFFSQEGKRTVGPLCVFGLSATFVLALTEEFSSFVYFSHPSLLREPISEILTQVHFEILMVTYNICHQGNHKRNQENGEFSRTDLGVWILKRVGDQ